MAYKISKNFAYSKELLYEIVADVKSYPEFLPWIKSATVYDESEHNFEADLTIKFGPFEKTYGSEVFLSNNTIKTQAKSGSIFSYLNSTWQFIEINSYETCVEFSIDFKLNSSILQLTVGKLLEEAAEATIKSFEERAAAKKIPRLSIAVKKAISSDYDKTYSNHER
jgi:coenzyme Q-binding protein COQ10